MNLRSKNGQDVLTLDAAERRCLEKAQAICRKVAKISEDKHVSGAADESSVQIGFVLEHTAQEKKEAAK